jgi:hypothetical protein
MNKEEINRRIQEREDKIEQMVKDYDKSKKKARVQITIDENGNEYVHVDGEWIGTL